MDKSRRRRISRNLPVIRDHKADGGRLDRTDPEVTDPQDRRREVGGRRPTVAGVPRLGTGGDHPAMGGALLRAEDLVDLEEEEAGEDQGICIELLQFTPAADCNLSQIALSLMAIHSFNWPPMPEGLELSSEVV